MSAHAGAGLEDVDPGVHVADADDLVHIHVVVAADLGQLIGKGDVDGPEGVLHHLGHLGGLDVGDHDLALAEGGVEGLNGLAHPAVVGADGAVVVEQLIDHVAGDDALGGVDQVDILSDGEALRLDGGTDMLFDGAGGDGGLNDHSSPFGADLHDILHGGHHIAGVHLLLNLS